MSVPTREKISAVDTAWLRMDHPGNLMMICAVLSFAERVSLTALRHVIEERFLRFHRFRQRPVQTAAAATAPKTTFRMRPSRPGLERPAERNVVTGRGAH